MHNFFENSALCDFKQLSPRIIKCENMRFNNKRWTHFVLNNTRYDQNTDWTFEFIDNKDKYNFISYGRLIPLINGSDEFGGYLYRSRAINNLYLQILPASYDTRKGMAVHLFYYHNNSQKYELIKWNHKERTRYFYIANWTKPVDVHMELTILDENTREPITDIKGLHFKNIPQRAIFASIHSLSPRVVNYNVYFHDPSIINQYITSNSFNSHRDFLATMIDSKKFISFNKNGLEYDEIIALKKPNDFNEALSKNPYQATGLLSIPPGSGKDNYENKLKIILRIRDQNNIPVTGKNHICFFGVKDILGRNLNWNFNRYSTWGLHNPCIIDFTPKGVGEYWATPETSPPWNDGNIYNHFLNHNITMSLDRTLGYNQGNDYNSRRNNPIFKINMGSVLKPNERNNPMILNIKLDGYSFSPIPIDDSSIINNEPNVNNEPSNIKQVRTLFGVFEGKDSLKNFINAIFNWGMAIGTSLAIFLVVYAGIMYTSSGGNPDTTKNAKQWITGTLFSLAVLILARLIFSTIGIRWLQ